MGKKVLFRLDAGSVIGTGHMMRCLALAEVFQEKGVEVAFVTRTKEKPLRDKIESKRIQIISIPDEVSVEKEAEYLRSLAQRMSVAGMVVDVYDLPEDYFSTLRVAGDLWTLLQIEDFGHSFPGVDIVVNQNVYGSKSDYAAPVVFAGPANAIFRSEFRSRAQIRKVFNEEPRILVTLGGCDPKNYTQKIVEALQKIEEPRTFDVVIGPGFEHADALKTFGKSVAGVSFHENVREMRPLMEKADIAISAAGTTLLELLYMGLPPLTYVLAENQRRIAETADRLKLSVNMGLIEDFNSDELVETAEDLLDNLAELRKMSKKGQHMVDGRGAIRIVEKFIQRAGLENELKQKVHR